MTGMKHACFLRDPRTEIVVGEPRADLPIVPRLKIFLPQEMNRVSGRFTQRVPSNTDAYLGIRAPTQKSCLLCLASTEIFPGCDAVLDVFPSYSR